MWMLVTISGPSSKPTKPKPKEQPDDAPELAATSPATDDVVDARRRGAAVALALEQLPEKQRAALCLAAVEGLSYAEVAVALDVTQKAVKSLVHRARISLASHLAEAGLPEAGVVQGAKE